MKKKNTLNIRGKRRLGYNTMQNDIKEQWEDGDLISTFGTTVCYYGFKQC